MSAVPEGSFATIDGVRLHWHEAGAGPAVVWLHGSGPGASGWSNFRGNYPELAARGFRCLVPDAYGFGHSDKPEGADFPMARLCALTRGLLDHLGVDRFTLVGNSMGGAMALQLALDLPDRVERLVLMAPGGLESRDTYMAMPGIQGMMRTVFSRRGYTPESIRALFELQLHDPAQVTDAIVAERLEIALVQPRRVFETLAVPDLSPRLGEIRCPTLALWGREDQFCPVSGATTLARGIADVRSVTLSQCGHWVMVERRALFNRMLADFLTGAWG